MTVRRSTPLRVVFGVLRLLGVALIISAVVGQFAASLSVVPDPALFVVNFTSFFTIQSNLLGAVVLAVGAWVAFRHRIDSERFTLMRACAATYLITTLVVYNLLLRGFTLDQATTVPWSNEILHVWAPLLVLLDWVFAPGRARLDWRHLWAVAIYPAVWLVYTMVRGALIDWYPYPFLDPTIAPGVGIGGVTIYIIAIAAFILLTGAATFAVSRVGGRPIALREPLPEVDTASPGSSTLR